MNSRPALSVVMPVYNEEESIEQVVTEWIDELDTLDIPYELIVLDDGSRDQTGAVLREIAGRSSAVRVLHHENMGHGPTILRGYAETRGEWVLQIDSDGEISPRGFADLWRRREEFDVLVGRRVHRSAGMIRQVISGASRLSVRLLFGPGIHDVNVPYRLMKGPLLRQMAADLPRTLFAPNVILSGLAIRRGYRIHEEPVEHVGRRHGRSSLGRLRIFAPAARSLWQTWIESRRDRSRRAPW